MSNYVLVRNVLNHQSCPVIFSSHYPVKVKFILLLLSTWLEAPSFLRFLVRSLEGSNGVTTGIMWPLPGNIIPCWWCDWSPTFLGAIGKSTEFLPACWMMLWETKSTECGPPPEIRIFPRDTWWKLEALGDSPIYGCCRSQIEGLMAGADPTLWLFMGKTVLSIWDGAPGSPCSLGIGRALLIPPIKDGEFGHKRLGGWGEHELLHVRWCPARGWLPLRAAPKTEKESSHN